MYRAILRTLVRRIHRLAAFVAEQTAQPDEDVVREPAPIDAKADWHDRTRSGGPPEHWLELVRKGAPQLLDDMQQGRGSVRLPKPADMPTSAAPPVQIESWAAENTTQATTQPEAPRKHPQRQEQRIEAQKLPASQAGEVDRDRVAPRMEQPPQMEQHERKLAQFQQRRHVEARREATRTETRISPEQHLRLSPALPRKVDIVARAQVTPQQDSTQEDMPPAVARAQATLPPGNTQEDVFSVATQPPQTETVIVHLPERRPAYDQENRQDGRRRAVPPAEVIQRHAEYRPPDVSLPQLDPQVRWQSDAVQVPAPFRSPLRQSKPVVAEEVAQGEQASVRWSALPDELPQAGDEDLRELLRAREHLQRLDREQQGIEGWNERHF